MVLFNSVWQCALMPLLLSWPALASPTASRTSPTAKTVNGTYKGVYNSAYKQDFFLGIPYAQPPVGDLRFRVPQPLNSSWGGSRNATEYSRQCIGYGSDTWVLGNYVSEDCLTINVVRPSGTSKDDKLPVALWIHGGSLTNGGSSDPRYNLSFIVDQSVKMGSPIVAASINYRLHGWGFLHSADLAAAGSTNLGFRDQRLALHWVKENIARFGGDPKHVTIWGESAGARSVGAQLVAYGGRNDGLFHGAVLQSGSSLPGLLKPATAASWATYYSKLLEATGCTSASDSVACLRSVPTAQLSSVFNSSFAAAPGWGQVVDNDFFVAPGDALLKQGKFVKVPLLLGTNFDEGTAYATTGINTDDQFLALVKANGVNASLAEDVAELYPDDPAVGIPATLDGRPGGSFGQQWKRVAAYRGDTVQHGARRLTAQSWAEEKVPVWSYHWNVLVNGISAVYGATHFQEVVFVFNNLNANGYSTVVSSNPFTGKPETFVQLANLMSRMWVSFFTESNPNFHQAGSINWPQYKIKNPKNLVFDVNTTKLAYSEPDTYRDDEISFIIDNLYS
ncbi:Alpha/Beta hydrolase protein [Dactylonectria macrodidyma]|uniref:Carboxylic ester hydrolase n=1 Tax=Dactylonectria macrodidyma TaxID=307937 RepID=A0A9P9J3A0_9HYPO|nr:Alpha/Beta hydrolase protein [Dactylonectria macrodidyma]